MASLDNISISVFPFWKLFISCIFRFSVFLLWWGKKKAKTTTKKPKVPKAISEVLVIKIGDCRHLFLILINNTLCYFCILLHADCLPNSHPKLKDCSYQIIKFLERESSRQEDGCSSSISSRGEGKQRFRLHGCRKGCSEHQKEDLGKGVEEIGSISTWKSVLKEKSWDHSV